MAFAFISAVAQDNDDVYRADNYISSQKDYLITTNGDTIVGEIRNRSSDWVKFKKKGEKKFVKIPSFGIKHFFVDEERKFYAYKKIEDDGELLLLEVLTTGRIILYEYLAFFYSPYGNRKDLRWYAEKAGLPLVEIKTNSLLGSREDRKNAFVNLISDQPALVEKFYKEEKFSFKFLSNLVDEYNLASGSAH